jgi:LPS-assembly protein
MLGRKHLAGLPRNALNGIRRMILFSRTRNFAPRQTLTGLGMILAAIANPAHAGWDCSLDAKGEWLCQAGDGNTNPSGSEVVTAPDETSVDDAAIEATAMGASPEVGATADTDAPLADVPAENLTTAATSPTRITQISDDWVPLEKLSESQKEQLAESKKQEVTTCCGMYVDPVSANREIDPANTEVNAHADETDTDIANQVSQLKGNVQVTQGYRYLRADNATLKKNPQQVTLEGNVTLREPGLLLTGDKADLMVDENTVGVENVQYLMHKEHIHGSAQSLSRSETGVVSMIDANYSYCPVGYEQWALQAGSLTLDPNDSQGRARNVTLRVKDVPVFYTPYLQFPLGDQRMSGFLVPSFGLGEDGVDMQTPYYFNLAPDYDLTLTPRYIGDRGLMLGSKFRHMSESTSSTLITSLLPNDNAVNSNEEDQRWYVNARHDGADKRWESLVDMAAVSDEDYFHDFSSSGLRVGNTAQLRKQAQFAYLPDNWRVGVNAKEYQTLDDTLADPHKVLPSLFADGNYALESGPVINLHQSMTKFDHRDDGNRQDLDLDGVEDSFDTLVLNAPVYYDLTNQESVPLTGSRYNLDYSVALPLRSAGAFLTPKVGIRHVTQQLDQTTVNTPDSNPSTTVGVASVDSGLIFERNSQWFGNSYRQTLEPRVFYYYAQQKDQDNIYNFDSNALSFSYPQLFRDYRLAGEDYIDDANQLSTGVSTRLLSPVTGRELLEAGIGQTYYLDKREVVLEEDPVTAAYERGRSRSSIVMDLTVHLNREWDIRTETLWNDDKAIRERQSLALRYRDEEGRLFNTGYQYLDRRATANAITPLTKQTVDRTVEQAYVSGVYPIGNQWSLIGHWNHDITNSRELEAIAGFEYDSCCWSARVIARRWVINDLFIDNVDAQDTRQGIFLQVQLKSLGNIGDNIDSTLSDSILGYEDRNKALD